MTAIGARALAVRDPVQAVDLPAWLLYPTDATPRAHRVGPYELALASDAAPARPAAPLGLVLISHGAGGSPWVYRGHAAHLVGAGFAVAMLEHPGNSRSDNRLADTVANLENRPRHLRLVADAAFADPALGAQLAPGWVAVVGHSIGGYTALAAAGGRPQTLPPLVDGQITRAAAATWRPTPIETTREPRLAAAVLLAPAIGWFLAEGALAEVAIPLLVRTGEHDAICATRTIRAALRSVPDPARVDLVEVPGAGHFSFSTPFPAELTRPGFAPAHDPPGFDRATYQAQLLPELAAFLRAQLPT